MNARGATVGVWIGSVIVALALAVGCASPTGVELRPDAELAQYIASAQNAFRLNSFERAARFYELALQRARAIDDSQEVGKQAYNLAAALLLAERPADALPYLTEAEASFQQVRRDRGPVLLLRARALRAAGQVDAARAEVQKVVELKTADEIHCQGWLLFGQMAYEAKDEAEAAKALSRARSFVTPDPALRAGVAALAGRVALLKDRADDAGLEFDKETELFRQAGRFRDMAESLQRAAEAYVKAGDAALAGQRYYRAARSWLGLGEPVRALKTMESALGAIGSEDDAVWGPEMAALFEEIRNTPVAGTRTEKLE
ncbi:MAG: hypothetical protein J5I99_05475 [Verrucomicrobia bacterium]|nr:hypothetical protein [Kiritimatiellia bacterium]MCO6400661.1 hypothetical protein [Verrucomicrobiota bacterium]